MITKNGEIIVNNFRGINVKDNAFNVDDSECQIATNVLVNNGAVEVRGGLDLHSQNNALTGGVSLLYPYYKRDGTAQLIIGNDDDYYYITPANTTWQTIGDYGTAVNNPTAFQYKDLILFGTGSTSNTPKKWNGTSFTNITTPASANGDLGFYTQFVGKDIRYVMGAGVTANNSTDNITALYYTPEPDNWGAGGVVQVGPQDGQDITGIIQNNNLVVYKEGAKHNWDSFYEENSGAFAIREFGVDRTSGSVNHETLMTVDGDVIALVGKGRSIEGYGLEGTAQGNARPKQYATNINPILNSLNWQKSIIRGSKAVFFDRKAFISAPFLGSQFNNLVLVGDWDTPTRNMQPSWTTWGKNISSMAIFRDSNGESQLYLGDALQPKIYRYNPSIYSDNGFGYLRRWRSKKFSPAGRESWGDNILVIIAGYIASITEFTLSVIVDGQQQDYLISSDQLVDSSDGGGVHIGDRIIGEEIIGGESTGSDKYRYLAVAEVPNALRYAKNVEIEISNSSPGQYWSLDYLSINEKVNLENIPARHRNLIAA